MNHWPRQGSSLRNYLGRTPAQRQMSLRIIMLWELSSSVVYVAIPDLTIYILMV